MDCITNFFNIFDLFGDKLFVLREPFSPFTNYAINIDVLLIHEYHTHSRNSGWRSELQIVSFKYEINIAAESNSLSGG